MPFVKSRQLGERAGAHGGIIRASYSSPQSPFAGTRDRMLPIRVNIDDTPSNRNIFISEQSQIVTTDPFRVVVGTPAVNGGGATVMLKKCTGTQAPSAGTDLLTAAVSLDDANTDPDTVKTGTMVSSAATRTLAAGDRLALVFAGTLTNLDNIVASLGVGVVGGSITPVHMVYTARRRCRLMHLLLSSDKWDGAAIVSGGTVDVTKVPDIVNPTSGTTLLVAPIDIATILQYQNVEPQLVSAEAQLTFNAGDRMAIKYNACDPTSVNLVAEFLPLPDELFWLSR